METNNEALTVAKPEETKTMSRVANLNPRNFSEAWQLAKLIAKSEVCPKDFRGKSENILIAMQMGAEVGLAPMAALQNIAVINGRPSLWGDAALGVCQANPNFEWISERLEGTADKRVAVCQVKRKGAPIHERRFSVEDAKTAKLWGKRGANGQDTPWITYPDRMLTMRARGFALRDQFADSLRGMILAEEAMDIPVDQRRTIETGKLSVEDEVKSLVPSTEENRGHGNEGFGSADQPEKPYVDANGKCTECGAQGGHLPKCSLRKNGVLKPQAETKAPEAQPEPEVAPEPAQTQGSGLMRGVVKVKDVEPRMKKVQGKPDQPYFLLILEGKASPIYVWHQSLHEFAVKMKGREVDVEVESSESQGRVYWSLENIYSVTDGEGTCKFVNNKPVLEEDTGAYEQPTGAELFPPVRTS